MIIAAIREAQGRGRLGWGSCACVCMCVCMCWGRRSHPREGHKDREGALQAQQALGNRRLPRQHRAELKQCLFAVTHREHSLATGMGLRELGDGGQEASGAQERVPLP